MAILHRTTRIFPTASRGLSCGTVCLAIDLDIRSLTDLVAQAMVLRRRVREVPIIADRLGARPPLITENAMLERCADADANSKGIRI